MSADAPPGGMPAMPLPVDPSDPGRGPLIMGISWTLTSICVLFIVVRLWVRSRVTRTLGADDWLMLVAGVLQVGFQACITVGYTYGLGKRDMNLSFDQLVSILKWMWISSTFSILASTIARISIAVLLIRLFGLHLWLKWFLIVFTAIQSIGGFLIILFVWVQVKPVEGLWNPLLPATRWNPDIQKNAAIVGQSLFTVSDLTYVLFPVLIIWRLNMPTRDKVGLISLMAFSLLTMAASIMKTITSQSNALDPEAQYKASLSVLWSAVESGLVIAMGCVPPLRSLMRLDFPILRSIRSTLASLMGTSGSAKSGHSGSAYSDLDLDSRKRGEHSSKITAEVYSNASSQNVDAIRRGNNYTVTYE